MIKTDEIIATLKDKMLMQHGLLLHLIYSTSQVIEVNLMKDCLRYL